MQTQPTSTLTIHPSLAALPMTPESDPASQAIVASVCEIGIIDPLKICKGRVVDGRDRLRAARAAGLDEVPITEVSEDQVADIILHSLVARRHYGKMVRAYVAWPVFATALAHARKRRLNNLRKGQNSLQVLEKPEPAMIAGSGISAERAAEILGVGLRTMETVEMVHRRFDDHPKLRDEYEAKLLSGEIDWVEFQHASAGKAAGRDGHTIPKGDPAQLMLQLFETAHVRIQRWDKLDTGERSAAADAFRSHFLPSLPDALLQVAEEYIRARRSLKVA